MKEIRQHKTAVQFYAYDTVNWQKTHLWLGEHHWSTEKALGSLLGPQKYSVLAPSYKLSIWAFHCMEIVNNRTETIIEFPQYHSARPLSKYREYNSLLVIFILLFTFSANRTMWYVWFKWFTSIIRREVIFLLLIQVKPSFAFPHFMCKQRPCLLNDVPRMQKSIHVPLGIQTETSVSSLEVDL